MRAHRNVLVVEDDPVIRQFLETAIQKRSCNITSVADGRSALKAISEKDYDLVFADLKIPQVSGMKVLEYAKKTRPDTSVVISTAYGSIENAVEAMRKGAFDYLTKPFSIQDIFDVIDRVLEGRCPGDTQKAPEASISSSELLGKSDAIKNIRDLIAKLAPTRTTILIEGQTGVGKEVVADALQQASLRKDKPFVKVNCAALPDSLVESELFGYEKGAFTGAFMRNRGRFELADGGTILLDEIGELALPMQAKLLRVLQGKRFERLGSGKLIEVDVRIIATTNRDLKEEVKTGRFRKDLFFRLNVVKISIPPLNMRKADISLLAHHFVSLFAKENNTPKRLSAKAIERLCEYEWPGNVRELQNVLEKAVVTVNSEVIQTEDLELVDEHHDLIEYFYDNRENVTIYEAEKELILKTLKKTGHNKTKAAEALGITAKTLRNKLAEYGLQSTDTLS
jgi:DNA-binding NtrC family response regulator